MSVSVGTAFGLLLLSAASWSARCPEITYQQLREAWRGRGPIELIFFATWCPECAASVQKVHTDKTVLISTFDERARAEAVLTKLEIKTTCVTGIDIAEKLGIRELPATKTIEFGSSSN